MSSLGHGGLGPPKVLVVAIGNPDRGDDGVGALVAIRLAGRLPSDVKLMSRHGDIISLIEDWAGFDVVICIDAAEPSGTPGRIDRFHAGELPRGASFASSHAFGLAETIALAGALRSRPKTLIVYAIEGGCFDHGAALTPQVVAAAAEVADRVVAEVSRQGAFAARPLVERKG